MTVTATHDTATTTPGRDRRTRRLLSAIAAGTAVFGVVSLAQAATREGFDLTRYPLSSLSNGDLGWLQITNFVVSGLLVLAGAAGLHRALRGTPGGTWGPRLIGIVGIGLTLCGPFVLQGGSGFPVGDPGVAGITVGTIGHLAAGTVAFTALIAACFVLAAARRPAGPGDHLPDRPDLDRRGRPHRAPPLTCSTHSHRRRR